MIIRTDGGARGNPGPAAAGVAIGDENGVTLLVKGFYLGESTNNVAEYEGLLRGLEEAKKLGGTRLKVYCDSELVVRQVIGVYKVKKNHLKQYHRDVVELMGEFEQVELKHVKREENMAADAMVNAALERRCDINGGM